MHFDIHAINPYIRLAIPSVLTAGTEVKRRVIFDYELIYLESGAWILTYDNRDYRCSAGDVLLLRPGVSHAFRCLGEDVSQPHIHFDMTWSVKSAQTPISFKDLSDLTAKERGLIQHDLFEEYPQVPLVRISDKEAFLDLFYGIIRAPKSSELVQKVKLLAIIDMLIADNFTDCFAKEESRYGIAHRLKDYLDAGQGMAASLADLEKQFSYNKYYLEREFKKRYGMSLIAYRNKRRMELAQSMLQSESVSAVAEALGFSSIYVFSRACKQYFGVSPSELKK